MSTKADSSLDGIEDEATSENSKSKDNQTGGSQPQYVTVEQFNRLNQGIEALRRSMQSDKDRAVKRVEEKVTGLEGDVRTVLQSYAQNGKSVGDVLADLDAQEEREARQALLDFSRGLKEGRFPGSGSGGTGQQQGVDVSAVLSELEMDEADIRVKEFRSRSFTSEAEAYREGAKLLKKIHTNQPSDVDLPSPEGKRQSTPQGQDALRQEYQTRSKGIYGQQLLRLKKEMRDKGLEIT